MLGHLWNCLATWILGRIYLLGYTEFPQEKTRATCPGQERLAAEFPTNK